MTTFAQPSVWGGLQSVPVGPLCKCRHGREAHRHRRRGSDCSACGCSRFRKRLPIPAQVFAGVCTRTGRYAVYALAAVGVGAVIGLAVGGWLLERQELPDR